MHTILPKLLQHTFRSIPPTAARGVVVAIFLTQIASAGIMIQNPGIKWRFRTEGAVRAQPLIVNTVVIVGSSDGTLYALGKETGELRWRIDTGAPITAAAAHAGDRVYFVSDDQYVYAADIRTGAVKWRYKMNALKPAYWEWDYYVAAPVVENGTLWIGSGDGSLYALEAMSGTLKWKFETSGRIRASPAIDGNTVYVPSNDGIVYALEKASGKLRWKFNTDGASYDSRKFGWDRSSIYAPPIVADSLLIIGSRDGKTYAVNTHTHKEQWSVTYGPTWAMSATVASGTVYIGWSDNSLLSAVDLRSGKEVWKFQAGSLVYTKPLVTDEEVVVGSADEKLYCLNRYDGSKRWEYKLEGSVFSGLVADSGVVFTGCDAGYVYAIEEKSAKPLKAVYHPVVNNPGLEQAFLASPRITPLLTDRGFIRLDTTTLKTFLDERIADRLPSVIVFPYEQIPASVVGTDPAKGMLRRYLDNGGKVVWFGNVPDLYTVDKAGRPAMDVTRAERMLDVRFIRPEESGNYYSRITQAGRNMGLLPWQMLTYANVDAAGVLVLGSDGFGRVTGWMKRYNPRPGSGFISLRTWGWYANIHDEDLQLINAVANYELE